MSLVVNVHIWVKPERVADFIRASEENARQSAKEPGIERFELSQLLDDPAQFLLTEVYRNEQAPAAHRETAHYKTWRDAVEPMMAQPRARALFKRLFPPA